MQKLSTGEDATLGNYRKIAMILNHDREDSRGVKLLDTKIKESSEGENGEVIAHETQMMYLLFNLLHEDIKDGLFNKDNDIIKELHDLREVVWGHDVPIPTTPEYREFHTKMQDILKRLDKIIDKVEKYFQ